MSISEGVPLTSSPAFDDSKTLKITRDVKDKIAKFGETASAQINGGNSHAGYEVVDREDSGKEYVFPSAPKFKDYLMHPIRSLTYIFCCAVKEKRCAVHSPLVGLQVLPSFWNTVDSEFWMEVLYPACGYVLRCQRTSTLRH